ncbi:MAG TPA: hypothetical protein VLD39_13610 [Gammaproteobacteria bacterium]|nr:hypothetical protein [Gammaproteobacteria bacterium]
MNTQTTAHRRNRRLSVVLPLVLIAAGATAQTAGTAEELREALKSELAPLRLSIKEQARTVAAELVESVLRELASTMSGSAPRPQLARRDGTPDGKNPS